MLTVQIYLTILFLIPLSSRCWHSLSPTRLPLTDQAYTPSETCNKQKETAASAPSPRAPLSAAFAPSSAASCMYHLRQPPQPKLTTPVPPRNLSVLMALDGEPGWVCLMCCNSDSPSPLPLHPRKKLTASHPYSPLQRRRHPMGHVPRQHLVQRLLHPLATTTTPTPPRRRRAQPPQRQRPQPQRHDQRRRRGR